MSKYEMRQGVELTPALEKQIDEDFKSPIGRSVVFTRDPNTVSLEEFHWRLVLEQLEENNEVLKRIEVSIDGLKNELRGK